MNDVEDRVCSLIQERKKMGKAKYGTSLADAKLSRRELLTHAMEEALDLAIYLKAVIEKEQQ